MMDNQYWCDADAEKLEGELCSRRKRYYQNLRSNALYLWQRKSWRLYNNIIGRRGGPKNRDKGIQIVGPQGEYLIVGINMYRTLLESLLILITGNKPIFKSSPSNNDAKSIDQSRLGEDVINYYTEEHNLEAQWTKAAEYAIVLGEGYIKATWDPDEGEELAVDEEEIEDEFQLLDLNQEIEDTEPSVLYEGDLRLKAIWPLDVIYDRSYGSDWKDVPWVFVKTMANRFDVLAQYPDEEQAILNAKADEDTIQVSKDFNTYLETFNPSGEDHTYTDAIEVWEFFHKKCKAIPDGRYVKMVGDTILVDTPLPYSEIPVKRMEGGDTLGTGWGHTRAFDAIAPQEIVNSTMSTIASEVRRGAISNYYAPTGGAGVAAHKLQGGGNVIEGPPGAEPKLLETMRVPQEVFNLLELALQLQRTIVGITEATQGLVDSKLSGTALALLDSKSIQFANGLIRNYYKLVEDSATLAVKIVRDFSTTERVITIVGSDRRGIASISFQPDELQGFTRFRITSQNPLFATTAGKMEIADKLLERGELDGKEEYITLVETGQLDPLYESKMAEITTIRRENEAMRRGEHVIPLRYDNHPLHIKEQTALLQDPSVRADPLKMEVVAAHLLEHRRLWEQLSIQEPMFLQVLGIPPAISGQMPMGQQEATPSSSGGSKAMERPSNERPDVQVRKAKPAQPAIPPITR